MKSTKIQTIDFSILVPGDKVVLEFLFYEVDDLWLIDFCNELKVVNNYKDYLYELDFDGNWFGISSLSVLFKLDIKITYLNLSWCINSESFEVFYDPSFYHTCVERLELREVGLSSSDILKFFKNDMYFAFECLRVIDFSYNSICAIDLCNLLEKISKTKLEKIFFDGCGIDLLNFFEELNSFSFKFENSFYVSLHWSEGEKYMSDDLADLIKENVSDYELRFNIKFDVLWS